MMNPQDHTPDTIGLFILGNLIYFLSIPIVSDIIPMLSVFMMYLINKEKVDKAAREVNELFKAGINYLKGKFKKDG